LRTLAFALAVAVQAGGPPALDVSTIAVSPPAAICELDMSVLRGEMRRLSWSPDNQYIHLQTVDDDRSVRDYVVDLHTREVSLAYGEPEWATQYWRHKADLASRSSH